MRAHTSPASNPRPPRGNRRGGGPPDRPDPTVQARPPRSARGRALQLRVALRPAPVWSRSSRATLPRRSWRKRTVVHTHSALVVQEVWCEIRPSPEGAPDQAGQCGRSRCVAALRAAGERADPAPCLERHPARPNFAPGLYLKHLAEAATGHRVEQLLALRALIVPGLRHLAPLICICLITPLMPFVH